MLADRTNRLRSVMALSPHWKRGFVAILNRNEASLEFNLQGCSSFLLVVVIVLLFNLPRASLPAPGFAFLD
jgi:hypothetical protein